MIVAIGLVYVAVILPFNAWTGYSYGYLGPDQPQQPSLLSRFGPWPLRVIPLLLVTHCVMAMLVVPWMVAGRKEARRL